MIEPLRAIAGQSVLLMIGLVLVAVVWPNRQKIVRALKRR